MTDIKLYSSSECIRCSLVKTMLNIHDVEYTEIKDNKELALAKEIEEYPSIEVDGNIIDGYQRVLMWLENNGWYSLERGDNGEGN